jgi:hypothetical protein
MNNRDLIEAYLGNNGAEWISDTAAHTAPDGMVFTSFQVVTNATLSAYTAETGATITGNTFTGVAIPAGTRIYGRFRSLTLTSGSILAYKGI